MSVGSSITGVDFVSLSTRDLAAAVEFYGEMLGLERSFYLPENHCAEFETGNVTINLVDGERAGIGHKLNGRPLALRVDDVDAARTAYERRGVRFRGPTLDTGVCRMAFFADPDGNTLMLHRRYAPQTGAGYAAARGATT